jgi:hypothetical protein
MEIAVLLRFVTSCRMKTIRIRNTALGARHVRLFRMLDRVPRAGIDLPPNDHE